MSVFIARKIKYFMVTMELRNFSKAADVLCITRSPLTKTICELEETLGGVLFLRKYNELEPTELALDWYEKIKPIYIESLRLESEVNKKKVTDINVVFDISIPELIYKYIVSSLKAVNIPFNSERKAISDDSISFLESKPAEVIISLREISSLSLLSSEVVLDKWGGDSLGFLMAEEWDLNINKPSVYIWKDRYSEYIRTIIESIVNDHFDECNYILHNYDSSTLLHQVHRKNGILLLPSKMAALYNSPGVRFVQLKSGRINFNLYHAANGDDSCLVKKIRSVLQDIM